jgi:hypothetical protein
LKNGSSSRACLRRSGRLWDCHTHYDVPLADLGSHSLWIGYTKLK